MDESQILSKIKQTGVSENDAKVLADCVVTRRSCSWVNDEPVTRDAIRNLLKLIEENNFKLDLSIKSVETRNKFIWEVKCKN